MPRSAAVARNLTFNFSRRGRQAGAAAVPGTPPRRRVALEQLSVVQSTYLTIVDFIDLFRSFMLHARKDLRDLFDQQLATVGGCGGGSGGVVEMLTPSSAGVGVGALGSGSGSSTAATTTSFPSCPVNSK